MAFVAGGATLSIIGAALPSLARTTGLTEATVSLTASWFSAGGLVGAALTILATRRWSLERLLPIALTTQAVALASFAWADRPVSLYLAGVVAGFGFGMMETAVIVLTNRRRDAPQAHGILNSAFAAGAIMIPIVVALVIRATTSPALAFVIAGVIHATAAVLTFRLVATGQTANAGARFPAGYARLGWMVAVYVGAEAVMATWVVALAERLDLISSTWGPLGSSVFWGGLLLGRISGTLAIRLATPRILLTVVTTTAATLVAVAAVTVATWPVLAAVMLVLGVIAAGPVFPLVVTELGETHGTAATVALLGLGSVGAVAGTALASQMTGEAGVLAIPAVLLYSGAVVIGLSLFRPPRPPIR